MMSYFSELRYKEVIDVHTGLRLGYACDLEFDDCEGCVVSLVTPGRPRFSDCWAGRTTISCRGTASSGSGRISSWWRSRANLSAASGAAGSFEPWQRRGNGV